jgi:hypothetical protein
VIGGLQSALDRVRTGISGKQGEGHHSQSAKRQDFMPLPSCQAQYQHQGEAP